jgi:type II restriction enzyme
VSYRLDVTDIVREIGQLGLNVPYRYVSGRGWLQIVEIESPEGPIRLQRWGDDDASVRPASISRTQLARIASACASKPNYPLHIDRLFSAGGNSRSALETLLVYTPHFFICNPKRVDAYTGEVRQDLKHFMWCPEDAHPSGQIGRKEYHEEISEIEVGVNFGDIVIVPDQLGTEFDTIELKRIHTQMQVALVEIGNALNFRTWIAQNDRHILVGGTPLGSLPGVIQSLDEMKILHDEEMRTAAALIDCIWFTWDGKRIPAVIEVEHSTRVVSGLTRMNNFRETLGAIGTIFTVVAPNELRTKVALDANKPVFRVLQARYMAYSTVRELYGLIQRYQLKNVVDHTFVQPFMEQVVT